MLTRTRRGSSVADHPRRRPRVTRRGPPFPSPTVGTWPGQDLWGSALESGGRGCGSCHRAGSPACPHLPATQHPHQALHPRSPWTLDPAHRGEVSGLILGYWGGGGQFPKPKEESRQRRRERRAQPRPRSPRPSPAPNSPRRVSPRRGLRQANRAEHPGAAAHPAPAPAPASPPGLFTRARSPR